MTHDVAAMPVNDLLLDLALAFPGIDAEAGPEQTRYFPGPKATFSQQVLMPDGLPVYLMGKLPGYVDGVHEGFRAWLEVRGWSVLPSKAFSSGTVHLLLPHESIRAWRRSRAAEIAAGVGIESGQPEE